MSASDLTLDTAVKRLAAAPGWYTALLPDAWSFHTPSGGVLMTVAMRAMAEELGDGALQPVSATAVFCSPVPAGALEIRVEVLRRGATAAQVRAGLSSTSLPGPGLEVSATFARDRTGPDFLAARRPELPGLDEAPRMDAPGRRQRVPPFFDNFESRLAYGPQFSEPGWQAGDARYARWVRYLVSPRRSDGTFDPLAIPPIADTMPPAVAHKLGPERFHFDAPSLDLTVHFLEPTSAEWLLVDTRCRRARAGYASAEAEIWDDAGRLVAYATQMMILRSARR